LRLPTPAAGRLLPRRWSRYDLPMPVNGKYLPLGEHLRRLAQDHSDVTLTFVEIERVLGVRLPQGARSVPFWEGVHGKAPPRARAWLSVGFVAQSDVQRERVRFHRQAPQARGGGRPSGHR
jgi:hypothetical protein